MSPSLRAAAVLLLWAAVCSPAALFGQSVAVPSIRRVRVLDSRNQVEIEIETSERVVPQVNVLTGPDRLVVDFVNALPGPQLRNQPVNREEVKNLRVGLFSSDPPVTRVVLDLNGPQPYQVFPSGRTVILKVGGTAGTEAARFSGAQGAALQNANYAVQAVPSSAPVPPPVKPPLEVSFQSGMLSISSNKASLSEVLSAVHDRTGAEIAIPGRCGAGKGHGRAWPRSGSGSSGSLAEWYPVQFPDPEFANESRRPGPRNSHRASRWAGAGSSATSALPDQRRR